MTKNEMAVVVVKALFNTEEIEGTYLERMVRGYSRWRKDYLRDEYESALRVIKRRTPLHLWDEWMERHNCD